MRFDRAVYGNAVRQRRKGRHLHTPVAGGAGGGAVGPVTREGRVTLMALVNKSIDSANCALWQSARSDGPIT